MISEYKYRQINADLERDLVKNKALLEAWQNVTFITAKNGKPFKNIAKNIIGADVSKRTFATQSYQKELYVAVQTPTLGYVRDGIDLYETIDRSNENYFSKPQNINSDNVYILDLDDVKDCVENKINYLNDYIDAHSKALANLEKMCEFCDDTYNMLKRTAGTQTGFTIMSEYMKYLLL